MKVAGPLGVPFVGGSLKKIATAGDPANSNAVVNRAYHSTRKSTSVRAKNP
jgi:hypothetical protein